MCLILFALNQHSIYKLIIASNRDEFFSRPTLEADFWKENKSILGGRDIQSGGTWLGLNKTGRFIAITNYRDRKSDRSNARSRGELSESFLSQNSSVSAFLADISKKKDQYNGFNILLSDDRFDSLYHYSNIPDRTNKISDGIHGLSNHLLDTSWPKVQRGKNYLSEILRSETIDGYEIIDLLRNGNEAPDEMLPETGISYDLEKKLSPVFISMKGYGTRCSTVILVNYDNELSFLEVSYNEQKQVIGEKKYNLQLK